MIEFHVDAFEPILKPELGTSFKYIERVRRVRQVIDYILLRCRQRRRDGYISKHSQANAVYEVIGACGFAAFQPILTILNRDPILILLDRHNGVRELYSRTEPSREDNGELLVAALQPKDLAFRRRDAARLHRCEPPYTVERADVLPSQVVNGRLRCALSFIDSGNRYLVEVIQSGAKRMVGVGKFHHVRFQIETLKFVPWVPGEKLDLAAIKTQTRERLGVGQHSIGVKLAANHSQIIVVVREPGTFCIGIRNCRNIELFRVGEESFITGFGDVVRAKISVKPIRQAIAAGEHMTGISSRSLEDGDVDTRLHQLIAAT